MAISPRLATSTLENIWGNSSGGSSEAGGGMRYVQVEVCRAIADDVAEKSEICHVTD
jgi:hypothetical protein